MEPYTRPYVAFFVEYANGSHSGFLRWQSCLRDIFYAVGDHICQSIEVVVFTSEGDTWRWCGSFDGRGVPEAIEEGSSNESAS